MAFMCLLAIETGMFSKVYMVFSQSHFMIRDKADFEALWTLIKAGDKVEYHVGSDFEPQENSLILVDESDYLMFRERKRFPSFISKKFCICFTGSPTNNDDRGIEASVVAEIGFK
jgi:hypothetical protein